MGKPSSNKKFIGWWTFPYRRVTYYIRFTSKGIRILTIKGKKVVPGKTIRKIVKPKNKGKNPKKNKNKGKNPKKNKNKGKNPKKPKNKVSFLLGRFPGLYTFKFPKVSFRFVISNRKIKIGRKTIRLKPSSNKKFIGWWTFPYLRVYLLHQIHIKRNQNFDDQGQKSCSRQDHPKDYEREETSEGQETKGKETKQCLQDLDWNDWHM